MKGTYLADGFYPTEILQYKPLDKPVTYISEVKDKNFSPVNLICIAGPFALLKKSDAGSYLDYSPLDVLLEYICRTKSNSLVLLLLGPFIDSDSITTMATGIMAISHQSFEEMFKEEISKRISRLLSFKIKVILMPSPNDLITDFVFPQGALSRDILSIPEVLCFILF